jgi:hypothetical protein
MNARRYEYVAYAAATSAAATAIRIARSRPVTAGPLLVRVASLYQRSMAIA